MSWRPTFTLVTQRSLCGRINTTLAARGFAAAIHSLGDRGDGRSFLLGLGRALADDARALLLRLEQAEALHELCNRGKENRPARTNRIAKPQEQATRDSAISPPMRHGIVSERPPAFRPIVCVHAQHMCVRVSVSVSVSECECVCVRARVRVGGVPLNDTEPSWLKSRIANILSTCSSRLEWPLRSWIT